MQWDIQSSIMAAWLALTSLESPERWEWCLIKQPKLLPCTSSLFGLVPITVSAESIARTARVAAQAQNK